MRYRTLGTTGVNVSTLCLGTMMYGQMGNTDHDDCIRQIHMALDAGVNIVDTADVYSLGESEVIVGKALAGRRDDVVLATKFHNPMGRERNHRGGSRRWIIKAVEDSLTRLQTDYIDLYQSHRLDWSTAIDETLDALTSLVAQGKVRYLGSSSFPAEWIVEAQWASERRRLQRFVCEQPQYSILARAVESAVLPTALRHDVAVIVWSPLAGGWLTGKYRRAEGLPAGTRFGGGGYLASIQGLAERPEALATRFDIVEALADVAATAGLSMSQLALGFVDAHPGVTSAIIGPRTAEQLVDALTAAEIVLDDATLDAIDAIVPPGTDAPGIVHSVPNPPFRDVVRRRRTTR